MGQLHDRMDADMEIRGLALNTRKAYLLAMRKFVGHFMRPPDQLTLEDIRQYQLYLTRERKVSWAVFNIAVAAIKFFYRVTVKKDWDIQEIPYQRKPRKLPEILSAEKVNALFSVQNLKHRAILMTSYAGGLRSSEVIHLMVSDIDSQRMVIRIDQGKGRKDRYVMLSPRLLETLREYWKAFHPKTWLFPSRNLDKPLSRHAVGSIVKKAKKAAQITARVYPHLLRHCFATHLLEQGTNLCVIQKLLGHRSLRSTEIYTHVAKNYLQETPSPLDILPDPKKAPPVTE
jgi:site-specific recombinase XerD